MSYINIIMRLNELQKNGADKSIEMCSMYRVINKYIMHLLVLEEWTATFK